MLFAYSARKSAIFRSLFSPCQGSFHRLLEFGHISAACEAPVLFGNGGLEL
jgi:hypothetical protein